MKQKTVILRRKITDVLLRYSTLGRQDAGVWCGTKAMLDCMEFKDDQPAKDNVASALGNMMMDGLVERKSVQGRSYWKLTIDGVISELESYFEDSQAPV